MMRFFKIFTETAEASASAGYRLKKTAASLLSSGLGMAVCAMAMLSSCNDDYFIPTPEPEVKASIDVSIVVPPVSETEKEEPTRHGNPVAGSAAENQITSLAFFAFNSSNTFELYKAITINPVDNTSSDPMWDPATSSLRLLLTVGQKTVYVIANWTSSMPNISGLNTTAALENLTRTHTTTLVNPPVMTAKITPNLQGGDQGISVVLTRQIARVTIFPVLSANAAAVGAQVTFEGIKLTGMASSSYVFPRNASPSAATWSQPAFTATPSTPVPATAAPPTEPPYSTLYIPEFFGNATAHTSMVIQAKYNGTTTYYTIPINAETGAFPALYAIERNHSYKYRVIVQGIGSETAVFAPSPLLDEPGVSNITYELEIEQ